MIRATDTVKNMKKCFTSYLEMNHTLLLDILTLMRCIERDCNFRFMES